jgi:hypothetical protein
MKHRAPRSIFLKQFLRSVVVALCVALLAPGDPALLAAAGQPQDSGTQQEAPKIPNDQLDSLVAPIALYPDPLLAQVLAASTYPLEIIQLQQWLAQHKDLKDKALEDAVMKQDWDPSVQSLAALPDVVKRLADDIKWTTDLGNAFLAQESDLMDAVQRMRAKAQGQGNLKSSEQMKVETQVVESKQVIVIQQANPQVIYVPTYNPVVVYGPPVYPYPAIYYPPPSYYAAGMVFAFGAGVAMGAWWSGGWGYNTRWYGYGGKTNITINNNNTFIRNSNTNINRPSTLPANRGGGNTWQHNPQHRGGAPYANQNTANKYGGTTRGSSQAARQQSARQQQTRQQGGGANRGGAGGAQAGTRPSQGQPGGGQSGNRPGAGGAQAGTRPSQGQGQLGGGQGQAGNRGGAGGAQAGTTNRGGAGGAGGGADRVGNRSVPPSTGSSGGPKPTSGGAFSGTSGGGNAARASSSRGASSTGGSGGARSGGGGARGGGGGGGRR